VNKGKKESKDNFKRARSPEKMGGLTRIYATSGKGLPPPT